MPDLERMLTEAMADEVRAVAASPELAGRVRLRHRVRRRRMLAVAGAAVVLCGALPGYLDMLPGHRPARVVGAAPSASSTAPYAGPPCGTGTRRAHRPFHRPGPAVSRDHAVPGLTVGYLPAGLPRGSSDDGPAELNPSAHSWAYGYSWAGTDDRPALSVWVICGAAARTRGALTAALAVPAHAVKPMHGHWAVRLDSPLWPAGTVYRMWQARPGVVVGVAATAALAGTFDDVVSGVGVHR